MWLPLSELRWTQTVESSYKSYCEGDRVEALITLNGSEGWISSIVRIVRDDLYMIETVDHQDFVLPADHLRPWSTRVTPKNEEFTIENIPVSPSFSLGEFIRNNTGTKDDDDSLLSKFLHSMHLISLREEDSTHIHLAGLAPNVAKVSRMIKFYNEYVSKLGSISQ